MGMGAKAVASDETKKVIDFLGEYIIKHFGDEEAMQRQVKYPKYEGHKQLHQTYIAEFKKIREEFSKNGASPKFTVGLNTSIVNWIISHIKVHDVEFGKFYQANKG
jgi:hemerythrin